MPPKKPSMFAPKPEFDMARLTELMGMMGQGLKMPGEDDPSDDNEDDLFDKEDQGKSKLRDVYRQMYRDVYLRDKKAYKSHKEKPSYSIKNPKCQGEDFASRFKGRLSPTVKWEIEQSVTCKQKPSVTAHITYVGTMIDGEAAQGDKIVKMGTIRCVLVKACAVSNAHMRLADVLDEHSEELGDVGEFFERIGADGEDFEGPEEGAPAGNEKKMMNMMGMGKQQKNKQVKNRRWVNLAGEGWELAQGALLYVQSITVEPEFEGTGAGLFMLGHAHSGINAHMSSTLIKISPFSTHDDGEMMGNSVVPTSESDPNFKQQGLRKLTALAQYYRILGFKLIGDPTGSAGDLYVCHWNGAVSPELREVVPHFCGGGGRV